MWRETTKHARNLTIFNNELHDFLPAKMLDFHVHCYDERVPPQEITFNTLDRKLEHYLVSELAQDAGELYPGRDFSAVCFGYPSEEVDIALNNAYILEACDGQQFFPFRLIRPTETAEALDRDLSAHPWRGIKPYLNFVDKPKGEIEIFDMMPHHLLEVLDAHRMLLTLHIPRGQRLADPVNQRQIVEMAKRYPNVTIILAHIGRAYYVSNVVGYLDDLRPLDNVYFDTTMVCNWEVLEYTFQQIQPHKLLYGTDIPLALAPGTSVEINNQYTYISPNPSDLSIGDDHHKLVFTSFVYEQLRAIKKAVTRCKLPRGFVEDLFYGNGMRLLQSRIGG